MKKTFREKYFELKKENEYLHIIINNKHTDIKILQLQFEAYKNNIENERLQEKKHSHLTDLIFGIALFVFLFLGIILKSFGLF